MFTDREVIYLYEHFMMADNKGRKALFTHGETDLEKEKMALIIYRHVVSNFFHLTPEEAAKNMSGGLLKLTSLDSILKSAGFKYPDFQIKKITALAFPESYYYSEEDEVLDYYKRAAHLDEYKNSDIDYRLPKNFFTGENGTRNASICFGYLVNNYLSVYGSSWLYDFFAQQDKAKAWLQKYGLNLLFKIVGDDTLELFHMLAPERVKDDYNYYKMKIYKYAKENPGN